MNNGSSGEYNRTSSVRPASAGRPQFNRAGGSSTGGGSESGPRSFNSRYSVPIIDVPSARNSRKSPWEGTSGFHDKPGEHIALTEVGFEFPFKKALLARYRPDAKAPRGSPAAGGDEDVLRGIWVEEPQKPVCFQPFTEDEKKAIASGNFCNFHRKQPHHSGPPVQGSHQGGYQGQHQSAQGGQERQQQPARTFNRQAEPVAAPPSTVVVMEEEPVAADEFYQRRRRPDFLDEEKPKGRSLMSLTRRKELESERVLEKALDERFNAPLNSRKALPKDADPTAPQEPVMPHKIAADLEEDGDPLMLWAERNETRLDDTFAYTKNVFGIAPHREEPPRAQQYQPDSTSSFFAQFMNRPSAQQAPPIAPIVTAGTQWYYRDPAGQVQGPFGNAKMSDWYSRQYFPDTLPLRREEDGDFQALSLWKQRSGGQAPFLVTNESALSAQLATAASPLSSFFDLNLNFSQPSLQSAPMTAPLAAAPSTKPLSEEESRFLSQLGFFGAAPARASAPDRSGADQAAEGLAAVKINEEQQPPKASPWGAISQARPVSLAEENRRPAAPAPMTPKAPVAPQVPPSAPAPLVSAASMGWVKPASPSAARPLEEILAEEEARAAAAVRNKPKGPQSFADLIKTSAPPMHATSHAQMAPQAPSKSVPSTAPMPRAPQQQPAPAPIPRAALQQQPAPAQPPKNMSVQQWAQAQLKPLAPAYDVDTVVSFLMSCPSSEDVASFVRDNIRSDRVNLPAFLGDFVSRRFGPQEAARYQGGFIPLSDDDQDDGFVGEFVTVDRRKAKKW